MHVNEISGLAELESWIQQPTARIAPMAEAAARSLAREGVEQVRVHDVSRTHPSYLIADAWRWHEKQGR